MTSHNDRAFSDVLGLDPGQVRLAAPNPLWAALYQAEAAQIRAALGPALIAVEHYGSTAIAGIQAKPILDILAGIERLGDGPGWQMPLAALGYDYAGPDIVPGHHLYGKGIPGRTHLLHVVEHGSVVWNEAILFRDALRADPALARTYEALKVQLSRRYAESRADYTAAKASFIESVIHAGAGKR